MTLCIRLDSAAGGGAPLPVYQELVKVNSWLHTPHTQHAALGVARANHSRAYDQPGSRRTEAWAQQGRVLTGKLQSRLNLLLLVPLDSGNKSCINLPLRGVNAKGQAQMAPSCSWHVCQSRCSYQETYCPS